MASRFGTVLVGGGSGFIGSALSKVLRTAGYDVITVSRKPGVWQITWEDLASDGLPDNCVAVVSLAGQNILDPRRRWTPGFKQNVWASRVNTTKSLADAIQNTKTPPEVFATISGVGYYKPCQETEYTENSSGGDHDFLAELCRKWESAGNLPPELPVRRVIVRSGVVLGRHGGMIQQMFWPFYLGFGGPISSGTQYLPWIHLDDIVGIFFHAISNGHVSGILNGVAPQVITNSDFTKAFSRAMWRPAIIPVPKFALNLAFDKERAVIMTEGQKVVPKRTLEVGYKYKYPDIQSACKNLARLIYVDQM
ncbi:epimerase family protein SDR39U1-like [Limulus polyphemus]|uniref:Epimerase family protein SDR39U1-like n=1 Tax=Limulus polyphemus TaxID=6850 RepID=A0ABM1BNP3_LIMPO|nr:epimerase family protein SDR39U1-like [Limulus polyphemus]